MHRLRCPLLLLSFLLLGTADPSLCAEDLSVDDILDRAHQQDSRMEEQIKDYTCRATFIIREPQKDGTAKTLMIQEKMMYHKSPDMDREELLSITEEGKVLSPEEVAEQQTKEDERVIKAREKDKDGETFEFGAKLPYDPDQRIHYEFDLLPPDTVQGIPAYVIRSIPKEKAENLMDGRLWLHGDLYEVIKLDFRPAKNPKFVKKIHVTIDFSEVQPDAWLPNEMKIDAQAGFLFFKKSFQVHQIWRDYEINVGLADSVFAPVDVGEN